MSDELAVERKYVFGNILGQGSFGVVRGVTSRTSGERLAVKIVHKDKVLHVEVDYSYMYMYEPFPLFRTFRTARILSATSTITYNAIMVCWLRISLPFGYVHV